MKQHLAFVCAWFFFHLFFPQAIYFHHAIYRTPEHKAYIETYMAVDGNFFKPIKQNEKNFQVKIPFRVLVQNASEMPRILNQYTLKSPFFSDTSRAPVFLDVQRYPIEHGYNKITIQLLDETNQRPLQEHVIEVDIPEKLASYSFSDMEWVEKYFKSNSLKSPLYKSGYEIYPYLVNYFPEKVHTLSFYTEAYTTVNPKETLSAAYFIEDADDGTPVKGFFKKIPWTNTSLPLPVIGNFDISALGTGNFFLVLKIINSADSILAIQKHFFQRQNFFRHKKIFSEIIPKMTIEEYVNKITDYDTLRMHIECLYPISSELEKERQFNHLKTKGASDVKKNYLIHFWTKKAGDSLSPYLLCRNYMNLVYEANALFRCGKQKGYNTEQGRVFLQYGKPSQVAAMYNEANTFPYEIWHYYRSYDQSLQRFVTNRKFVFVNNNLADNCFRLIHSDMRGEINNERWRYDIMKRFNNGIQNDKDIPTEAEHSQMNDLFQSPR